MSIPTKVRHEVRDELWGEADLLDWDRLSAGEKTRLYTIWTNSPRIGGRLAGYMDPRRIRVYLKDTLLKPYTRDRLDDFGLVLRILTIPETVKVTKSYIKPHGRCLADGRIIAWSRASEWKLTLLAIHERAFSAKGTVPYAAVLMYASAKYADKISREMIGDAANRLGIQQLVWLD